MADGNATPTEISKAVRLSPNTVKAVIEDRSFDKHLSAYQKTVLEEARGMLEEKLKRAAEKLIEIMEHGTPQQKIQLEATRDLLDRCGAKPHEVIERIDRQYTMEEVNSMLAVTKEIATITDKLSSTKSPYLLDKATKPKETIPSASTDSAVPAS